MGFEPATFLFYCNSLTQSFPLPILVHWCLSISPENMRKVRVFLIFSGGIERASGISGIRKN